MYDILDDTKRGFTGEGGQLNIWDSSLNKYVLFLPLETLPSVVGSTNTLDHDVTTSKTIGKIEGKKTIDNKEITFLWHRDNLVRLNEHLGEQCDFLVSYKDGTGWKFSAKYNYKPDDSPASEKATGTLTLIPNAVDDSATLDVTDLMARTCIIATLLDGELDLKASGTKTYTLTANVDGATYSATSSNTAITATISTNTLTITVGTGAKVGDSAIVEVKGTSTGMASWTTTILVRVVA